MAVTNQLGDQYKLQYSTTQSELGAVYPTEVRGHKLCSYFTHTQDGVGDAGSTVHICKLPAGRVRLLLPECGFYCNWTASTQTLDFGHEAYTHADGSAVAANADALLDGLDVDTAGFFTGAALIAGAGVTPTALNGYAPLFESRDGVVLYMTAVGALADSDDLAGQITFVCGG